MEPTLPPADQSLPDSNQENVPPRMVTPPALNVLVPVEEEIRVKECCQRTLAVRVQRAVRGNGAITNTGGKGSLTQWVHCDYIVIF